MAKQIIKGNYRSVEKLENRKEISDDANFGIIGFPNSQLLKELIKKGPLPKSDYTPTKLNTMFGFPNDPVLIKLINGSSMRDVHKEVGKKHNGNGILETMLYSLCGPTEFEYGRSTDIRLMRTEPLETMSKERLIQMAFRPFYLSTYGKQIEEHFRLNRGTDLELTMNKWYDNNTNKDIVMKAVEEELYKAYVFKTNIIGDKMIDVSSYLAKVNFSKSYMNPSEMIAIGGVQYIDLKGYLISQQWGKVSLDRNGQSIKTPTVIQVKYDWILGDWFGVDEPDITNNEKAAQIGRREMAALWVLQHQRGFRPFICYYKYSETVQYKFDITLNS